MMHKNKKSLLGNVISLAIIQGSDYLIPLMAIPFLLRTVGVENYGKIAFVQALSLYFVLLVEFGFNWTATRKVSICREDKLELAAIFWNVQIIKFVLLIAAAITIGAILSLNDGMQKYRDIGMVSLLPIAGAAFYPLWFLQGLEKMKETAALMLTIRASLLALMFFCVDTSEDLVIAAVLQMGATPLAAGCAWIYLIVHGRIAWRNPNSNSIYQEAVEAWPAFVAVAASSFYRSSNTVVLGFAVGPIAVAHYSMVEKIVKAFQEISRPIVQATYPRVSLLASENKVMAIALLKRVLIMLMLLGFASMVIIFIFGDKLIELMSGANSNDSSLIILYMSCIPLIGGINSVLGVQAMHAFGYSKDLSRIVAVVGIISLTIIFPLVFYYESIGAAISYVMSELLIMLFLVRSHVRNKTGLLLRFLF